MKNIISIIIIISFQIFVKSQSSYNPCYDPEWDWTIAENWQVYFPDNLLPNGTYQGVVNYPFVETEMNRDFRIILDNNDLSPDDGWVLLQKNLGCETYATAKPYVIFYNYHRGLIRIFALHTYNESASFGLLTVDWATANRSSALTFSNNNSRANDKYPAYDDDMVMLQIENFAKDQWWVGDFQVAFDHKTVSTQAGYYLNIRVYNVINSSIEFTSRVNLITKSLEVKGEKSTKKDTPIGDARTWAVENQKAIQKLNYKEWEEFMKKTTTGITDAGIWATNQWVKNDSYKWLVNSSMATLEFLENNKLPELLKGGAKALKGINSVLGFMVDFINFFSGKPSASSTPSLVQLAPMQITGTINSSGIIKTTTQQYNYTLPLPGTDATNPYYKCPLGVMNLKETPKIELRKWDETNYPITTIKCDSNCYNIVYNARTRQYDTLSTSCGSYGGRPVEWIPNKVDLIKKYWTGNKGSLRTEKWKSVRLKDSVQIAINSASGLELIDAKIALQGKIKRKSLDKNSEDYNKPAFLLFDKFEFLSDSFPYPSDFGKNFYKWKYTHGVGVFELLLNYNNRWYNKTFDKLNNKTYFLVEGGEDLGNGTRNEFYKFRTDFIDIKEAKNLAFTVRDSTEITLKIIAVFKEAENDEASLMVFTNEFILNEPESETDTLSSPYPYIRNQVNNTDFYPGANGLTHIINKTIKSGTYSDAKIETKGVVKINAISNVNFNANYSIALKPGFTANAGPSGVFSAKINNGSILINSSNIPMNQIAKYYKDGIESDHYTPCNCFPDIQNLKSIQIIPIKNQTQIQELNEQIEPLCEVFPNPCFDVINIDYLTNNPNVSNLSIYKNDGTLILKKDIGSGYHRIDMTQFSKGMYIIQIFDGKNIIAKKVIKE
jgi:hypothetical protein